MCKCGFPELECSFCEFGYKIDKGVVSVQEIAYVSGDVFFGCSWEDFEKLADEKELP